jgi:hypothetical protein
MTTKTIDGQQAGAIFVLEDTVIAFADSAERLDELCNQGAERLGKLCAGELPDTEDDVAEALMAEVHAGRMWYTGDKARMVRPTGRVLGCLIEFKCVDDDRLFYAFAERFEVREI